MGKNYFLTNSPLVSTGKQKKFSRQRAVVEWLLQAPQNIQFVLSPCYNRYNRPDDFIFVEANEAAGAMMGKSLDELIGQKLIELLNINPFHSFFQNYLRTFLYHTPLEESIEFPLLARKGKKITHRAEVVNDVLVVVVKVESLPQAKQPQKERKTQLEDALAQAEKREQEVQTKEVITTEASVEEQPTIEETETPTAVENEEITNVEASVETQPIIEEETPTTVESEEVTNVEASVETQPIIEETETPTVVENEGVTNIEVSVEEQPTIEETETPTVVESEEITNVEASVETQPIIEETETPTTVENEEITNVEASVKEQTIVEEETPTAVENEEVTNVEASVETQPTIEEETPTTVESKEVTDVEASVETQPTIEETETPTAVENEEVTSVEASVETQPTIEETETPTVVENEEVTNVEAKTEDFVLATPELEREETKATPTEKLEEPLVLATPELEKATEEQPTTAKELVLSTPELETEEIVPVTSTEQVAALNPVAIKALKRNKVSQQVSLDGKIEYTNQKLAKTLELTNADQSEVFIQDILHKVSKLPYQLALVKAQSGHNVTDLPLIFRTQSGKYIKVNALIKPQMNNGEVESIHHFFKVLRNTPNFNEVSSFGKVASFNAF
jgi:PAS domain-containing protein